MSNSIANITESGEMLQVVKLKLWEQLVPIAFFAHSEPLIPWQIVGEMLNIDHQAELGRLFGTNTFIAQQIDYIAWEDPEIVNLLGDSVAPWIALSVVPLWLAGLDTSRLANTEAVRTVHFLLMLLHSHPTKTYGNSPASALYALHSEGS